MRRFRNLSGGGVTILQLREKKLSTKRFIELALKVKKVTDEAEIKLIINDNIEVCKLINSHGVHIGQDDIYPDRARDILGKDKIIGLSIQTMEHLKEAEKTDIDYYGIGAVFNTNTKKDAADVDHTTLRSISGRSGIPVVAIGGINRSNIEKLENTNIKGVAIVSGIYGEKDVFNQTTKLFETAHRLFR